MTTIDPTTRARQHLAQLEADTDTYRANLSQARQEAQRDFHENVSRGHLHQVHAEASAAAAALDAAMADPDVGISRLWAAYQRRRIASTVHYHAAIVHGPTPPGWQDAAAQTAFGDVLARALELRAEAAAARARLELDAAERDAIDAASACVPMPASIREEITQ